jgi:[phosphatase 2A protein]-leucine-carboxy methyltransferase
MTITDGEKPKFQTGDGRTLWAIRESVIPPEELQRIAKLEHLDEIEELRLVLCHYSVVWGGKGSLAGLGL